MNPEPSAIEATLTAPGAPFEVVEGDVLGVPTRLWRSAPTSLIEIWQGSRAHGDRDYLVYRDERFTYAEAHAVVERLAARLAADYGLGQGDRFAIAMRNYPEWVLAFWAGISLGAVAVPLNAWWTGPELAYGLSDSASKVLFADDERLERLAPHLGDLSLAGVVGARTDAGKVAFKDLIETNGGDGSPPSVTVEPDDDVTILYTSGTTGRPKGAVGTHRNIGSFLFNLLYAGAARAAASAANASDATPASPPPAPATVLTFPLFHVGGLQSH